MVPDGLRVWRRRGWVHDVAAGTLRPLHRPASVCRLGFLFALLYPRMSSDLPLPPSGPLVFLHPFLPHPLIFFRIYEGRLSFRHLGAVSALSPHRCLGVSGNRALTGRGVSHPQEGLGGNSMLG